MTQRARRIYYSLAILVFCLAAPLVIALAAGWRWSGWRQGFVATGTMLVSANPRATVFLNGKPVGTTPKRLSGLVAGVYRLGLDRPGYTPWEHFVDLRPGTSRTIGPVQLFRSPLASAPIGNAAADQFLVSADQRTVAGWTIVDGRVDFRLLWPVESPSFVVPAAPTWITVSPRRQRLAVGSDELTTIYSLTAPTESWTIAAGEPIQWLAASDSIAYRLESGMLVAYDYLHRSRQILQPADSIATDASALWLGEIQTSTTSIQQRENILSTNAATVSALPGAWQVVGTAPHGVFARQAGGRTGVLLTVNRLSGRLTETPLGGITSVPANQTLSPPLWLNGVDILTLSDDSLPVVLARTPAALIDAAWIDPEDILVTLDAERLTIRSVSDKQGRGTVVSQAWTVGQIPLLLDVDNGTAIYADSGRLHQVQWH